MTGVVTQCMTWYFVSPYLYTYPRYDLKPDGTIDEFWPPLRSYDEFRSALTDPASWNRFVDEIRAQDPFYDPFLFRRNVLDRSTSVCLLRKAWAQRQLQVLTGRSHSASDFDANSSLIRIVRAIVEEFGREARNGGQLPVVLLLGDRGYDGHLDRAVGPALRQLDIPLVSTHDVCPSSDLKNMASDGHFTDLANERIARELLRIVGNFRRGTKAGGQAVD